MPNYNFFTYYVLLNMSTLYTSYKWKLVSTYGALINKKVFYMLQSCKYAKIVKYSTAFIQIVNIQ